MIVTQDLWGGMVRGVSASGPSTAGWDVMSINIAIFEISLAKDQRIDNFQAVHVIDITFGLRIVDEGAELFQVDMRFVYLGRLKHGSIHHLTQLLDHPRLSGSMTWTGSTLGITFVLINIRFSA